MHFKKLRSLFTKTQPSLQNGKLVHDTESSESRASSAGVKASDRKSQPGLILLNPDNIKPNGAELTETFNLDIVAIHGITGDAFKTWTHENGTNWLRDFLPKAFPGARIFSFGYPAEVFWSRSDGDMDSFARSLLEGLKREKRQLKHRSRRTMFICHSMGGIVVKKALTIARIDDDDYGEIRNSVSAILFLSTPHRGAGFASLLKLPLQMISSASLPIISITGRTRKDLIKGLEKDAEPLREISKNFRNLIKGIKIASFIEKSFVSPLKRAIVDESTGAMGIPGERIIPMHGCDHTTVCRFESETSFGYQSIFDVLQEWAEEAKKNIDALSLDDISCLRSLAFLEMDWRRSEADRAHPNTCNWILQHESYIKWLNKQRGLLWIKGKPGAGKSTLLAHIYRIFQENTSDQMYLNLEFFFHGRGAALQKTPIGMFRSLLHQLYTMDRSIREPIRKAFHDKETLGEAGKGWEWQLQELQVLLFNAILTAAKSRRLVIFIDALDEAGPKARELVEYLHSVNDEMNRTQSTAAMCISCRHYPVTAIIPGLDVLVEENNHNDISRYVQARLRANVRVEQSAADSKAWSKIEKKIVEDASGVFQWARLVVTMVLDQYEDGVYWDDIDLMLAKVPRELSAVYEHILNKIISPESRKKTLHLMQWVFLAERQLTLDELRDAMAFDDTHLSSDTNSFQDMECYVKKYSGMHKLVNSLSGGLAEVKYHEEGNIVQFIHQSVNDFMLSTGLEILVSQTTDILPGQSAQENDERSTNTIIGLAHDRLSRTCVNYFRLAELNWKRVVRDLGAKQFRLPFIEYAAKFWLVHAEKAEHNNVSQGHLVEQFGTTDDLLEKWIELAFVVDTDVINRLSHGSTFLQVASRSNLLSVVRLLLQGNVLIEAEDNRGNRALHYAARGGNKEVVELLLKAKAIPEAKNAGGEMPIEIAAVNGHNEVVELLLKNGSSIGNALQAAVSRGRVGLVRFLLNSGADINACGGRYGSALRTAAGKGYENLVRLLLAKGAQINLRNNTSHVTALQAAVAGLHENITQLLLDNGADVHIQDKRLGNVLQSAISSGDRAVIETILDKGVDVNAQGGISGTPLQAAAEDGDVAVVELLLDKGANVNSTGGLFNSPLQAACERARYACAKLLLQRGADVNVRDEFCGNPLQAAAARGKPQLVELLLQYGAEINAQGGFFGTALHAAASKGRLEIVKLLLRNGAKINAERGRYWTALQAASVDGHIAVVELLLKTGADANLMGGEFGSAIQAAAAMRPGARGRSIIALLLDHGADINIQGGKYPNALRAAIGQGEIHTVYLLLQHGAIYDPQDQEFSMALIAAAKNGIHGVEDLLEEKDILSNNLLDF